MKCLKKYIKFVGIYFVNKTVNLTRNKSKRKECFYLITRYSKFASNIRICENYTHLYIKVLYIFIW